MQAQAVAAAFGECFDFDRLGRHPAEPQPEPQSIVLGQVGEFDPCCDDIEGAQTGDPGLECGAVEGHSLQRLADAGEKAVDPQVGETADRRRFGVTGAGFGNGEADFRQRIDARRQTGIAGDTLAQRPAPFGVGDGTAADDRHHYRHRKRAHSQS